MGGSCGRGPATGPFGASVTGWSSDDVVTVFGDPGAGGFLSQVKDPVTGEFLRVSYPGAAEGEEEFARLMDLVQPETRESLVAILDTGMLHEHPGIKGRIADEVDFTGEGAEDLSGHGTLITLIYLTDVTEPMSSVKLLNIKVADAYGRGSPENLIKGLDWVANYKRGHPDFNITANLSVGVYRRRLLGLKRCNGTCDVCAAALRAADTGIVVVAAAGNTPGKTACPATAGLARPESGILAITRTDTPNVGIGQVAANPKLHFTPVETAEPVLRSLAGSEAYEHMTKLAENLQADGDNDQAEKVYRHLIAHGEGKWVHQAEAALGIMLAANQRWQESEDILLQSLCSAEPEFEAQVLYTLGYVEDSLGKPDRCLKYMELAVKGGHAHFGPLAASFIANIHLKSGQLDAAIPYLELATTSDDRQVAMTARYNRGKLWQSKGDRNAAYRDFQIVTQSETPKTTWAALSLAKMLAEEGKTRDALPWLQLASTSSDTEIAGNAYLGLGDIAAAYDGKKIAQEYYERAVGIGWQPAAGIARSRLKVM